MTDTYLITVPTGVLTTHYSVSLCLVFDLIYLITVGSFIVYDLMILNT